MSSRTRAGVWRLARACAAAAVAVAPAACEFNRYDLPGDPGDAGTADDARAPGLIVAVSSNGNDAHDGITQPVETLGRAVAIATANHDVTDIVLAAGRYTMRQGERFPYMLPANVVGLAGPPGGGAVLVGTGSETALVVSGTQIQNIALENFALGIDASGTMRIKNLRVAGSAVAIEGREGVKMRIDDLDIAGIAGSDGCPVGIQLDGVTDVTVTGFTAHDVSPAISGLNHGTQTSSALDLAMTTITLSPETTCPFGLISLQNTKLTLSDSNIDGGFGVRDRPDGGDGPFGIQAFSPHPTPMTITRTSLRHLHFGMLVTGADVQIARSEITDNVTGFQGGGGSWSLRDVKIARNGLGLVVGGDPVNGTVTLTMRDCIVSEQTFRGILVNEFADADLGTLANSGNNVFMSNLPVALDIAAMSTPAQIDAVGNSWTPNVQGADDAGRYPPGTAVTGPIYPSSGNNFAIIMGTVRL